VLKTRRLEKVRKGTTGAFLSNVGFYWFETAGRASCCFSITVDGLRMPNKDAKKLKRSQQSGVLISDFEPLGATPRTRQRPPQHDVRLVDRGRFLKPEMPSLTSTLLLSQNCSVLLVSKSKGSHPSCRKHGPPHSNVLSKSETSLARMVTGGQP
jgi:hypothetical protein